MVSRPRVIFVTSVFDEIVNGPGTYAHYLWSAFQDDEDIDFHLVAPRCRTSHPNLHSVESTGRSVMWDIQRRALQVVGDQQHNCVVHGNSAYMMFLFRNFPGPWLAQVNDYEAATIWDSSASAIRQRGLRRFMSLAWRHRQERKVVHAARRIICNSEYVREALLRCYGVADPAHLNVIHKAVDTRAFTRPNILCADSLPEQPRGARLLFIGANWKLKGLPTLLKSLSVVAKRHPDCQLTIVGPVGQQQETIRRLAHQLGVAERIRLAGKVSRAELPARFWQSDLFVLPANVEALGVSILEALAAGVPVVASDVGGIPEIIRSRDEGVLVPPLCHAELANAICRELEDEEMRRASQITGPARASEFRVEKMLAQIKQVYFELIEEAK